MMEIILTNNKATVVAPIDERRLVVELLSARPKGYMHMPAYKKGRWDGRIGLYDKQADAYPVGLTQYVIDSLAESLRISIDDRRQGYIYRPSVANVADYILRDNQQEAIQAIIDNLGIGTLSMATNAGKTLVAAGLLATLEFPTMLYVVPSTALLNQTYSDFCSYFPQLNFGRYGAGYHDDAPYLFTTLASLSKVNSNKDLLIVDECHRGSQSDRLFDQLMNVPSRYRVGMSGTPLHYEQLSDMKLAGVCGSVVYNVTNTELVEAGYSTPLTIKLHKLDSEIDDELDWQAAYRQFIVTNVKRNLKIAQLAHNHKQEGKAVMIMVNWIEHANYISQLLVGDYIYLSGELTPAAVADGMEQFRQNGGTLLCTPVLSEGVNLPNIDVLILAAGGKSHISLLQRLGRGMRKAEGKQELIVYDFIDNGNKYVFNHSKKRYEVYREQGFQVEVIRE